MRRDGGYSVGDGGNRELYLRRRLRRDSPDLYEEVASGRMSASAAAIAAGIRRPYVSVAADDPEAAVRTLLKRYTLAELLLAVSDHVEAELADESPADAGFRRFGGRSPRRSNAVG